MKQIVNNDVSKDSAVRLEMVVVFTAKRAKQQFILCTKILDFVP